MLWSQAGLRVLGENISLVASAVGKAKALREQYKLRSKEVQTLEQPVIPT